MAVVDYFLKTFDVEETPDKIILNRYKTVNGSLWIVALIILITSIAIIINTNLETALFFICIDVVVLAILWVNNQHLIYPRTIIDFNKKTVERIPAFSFLKAKKNPINETIKGIDLAQRAVSGYASPFEEGNTDFRKKIILILDNSEIELFNYLSRHEKLESSVEELIEKIKQGLKIELNV